MYYRRTNVSTSNYTIKSITYIDTHFSVYINIKNNFSITISLLIIQCFNYIHAFFYITNLHKISLKTVRTKFVNETFSLLYCIQVRILIIFMYGPVPFKRPSELWHLTGPKNLHNSKSRRRFTLILEPYSDAAYIIIAKARESC